MGVPYQSVLYMSSADCALSGSRKCDLITPGKLWVYDKGIKNWYVESETSACCGYKADTHPDVVQFVTEENQTINYLVPEGKIPPTLEEAETGELRDEPIDLSNITSGGIPLLIACAVCISVIAVVILNRKQQV